MENTVQFIRLVKSILTSIRKFCWPIEWYEYKKFIPMALMMTCILFSCYTGLLIRDGLVITHIGVEAISFLKTYLVLPLSIIMMLIYLKLCDIMSEKKVFCTIISFFLVFFAFFTFILYPNPEIFRLSFSTVDMMVKQYPNLKWFIKIVGSWSYASFYIISELWGMIMMSILFWQCANQITTTSEAKRFYPMLMLVSNIIPLLGLFSFNLLLNKDTSIVIHLIPDEVKLIPVLCTLLVSGIAILFCYCWINNHVLTDPLLYNKAQSGAKKKNKTKLSLGRSLKMIFTSKYLALISMMTIGYGISTNLIECIWKSRLHELYRTVEGYTSFMGTFMAYQGVASIFIILIGSYILRRVSWTTAAILTPLLIFCIGILFFSFCIFEDAIGLLGATFLNTEPIFMIVSIGAAHSILSKATGCALLNSTKEMAYIPLDNEMKSKGRVSVFIIGAIFSSVGGLIQVIFFTLSPASTYTEAAPFFATVFFIIIILWVFFVNKLGQEYQKALLRF
jgi:AAA family ATP:ADP antiporter